MAKKELRMRAVVAPTETVIVSAYDFGRTNKAPLRSTQRANAATVGLAQRRR